MTLNYSLFSPFLSGTDLSLSQSKVVVVALDRQPRAAGGYAMPMNVWEWRMPSLPRHRPFCSSCVVSLPGATLVMEVTPLEDLSWHGCPCLDLRDLDRIDLVMSPAATVHSQG